MKCTGIFMPPSTLASLENQELVMSYIEAFVDSDGILTHSIHEMTSMLKIRFGHHLGVVYYDPMTKETTEVPGYYYHLMITNDSHFYSHERH